MQQTHAIQPYDVSHSGATGRERFEGDAHADAAINVHDKERLASLALGALALVYGTTRRTPAGIFASALGSALIYRGVSGHCHVYGALGLSTAAPRLAESARDEPPTETSTRARAG